MDATKQRLQTKHMEEMARSCEEMSRAHKDTLDRLRTDHDDEVCRLRSDMGAALSIAEERLNELRQNHSAQVDRFEEHKREEISALVKDHSRKVAQLSEQIEELSSRVEQVSQSRDERIANIELQRDLLEEQLRSTREGEKTARDGVIALQDQLQVVKAEKATVGGQAEIERQRADEERRIMMDRIAAMVAEAEDQRRLIASLEVNQLDSPSY